MGGLSGPHYFETFGFVTLNQTAFRINPLFKHKRNSYVGDVARILGGMETLRNSLLILPYDKS